MKIERTVAAGAVVGIGIAMPIFLYSGNKHDWDPAAEQRDRVADCLPYTTDHRQHVLALPEPFEPWKADLQNTKTQTYDIPTTQQVLNKYEPGEHYNEQYIAGYGAFALASGVVAGGLTWAAGVVGAVAVEEHRRRKSRYAGNVTISRRFGRFATAYFDGLPLDCEVNRKVLNKRYDKLIRNKAVGE